MVEAILKAETEHQKFPLFRRDNSSFLDLK